MMQTYRFANYGDPTSLEARIQAAVTDFYRRHGVLPSAIVVNPANIGEAASAAKSLDLSMPIEGLGGILANEVWLQCPLPTMGGAGALLLEMF